MKRSLILGSGLACLLTPAMALGQDYSVLRINEVIAENDTQEPRDVQGSTTDMVEIYNAGTEVLVIGHVNTAVALALTDSAELPPPWDSAWTFRNGTTIQPGQSIIVFCDGSAAAGICEHHASFRLASDGSEPISLWGPVIGVDAEGRPIRELIDQVWLPPLRSDVSIGRYPDGAGPAPVPIEQVLETFVFHAPGDATFGRCIELPRDCGVDQSARFCVGAPNTPGSNVQPKIVLRGHSTNSPAAGDPVRFRVEVSDEKGPVPPNIAAVEIVYRIDGGAEQTAAMRLDAVAGGQQGVIDDCNGPLPGVEPCPNPFDFWTHWDGEVPGQPAGARVELFLRARDAEGAADSIPSTICAEGVGPCDRHFGGPGCVEDGFEPECSRHTPRFESCKKLLTYRVAFEPPPELAGVVINEVVSQQIGLLKDPTEPACSESEAQECPPNLPNCCPFSQDFIEIFNASATQGVNLAGLWLSNNAFQPRGWQFPPGSTILPLERLIIWIDGDGGFCPDPFKPPSERPCTWECPDPTSPALGEYHTSFTLDASGDEIYLFDREENGFGVIHGVSFERIGSNRSLSLVPDGNRRGCWTISDTPTPREHNTGFCSFPFRRADANSDCVLDLTDAIHTLGFLFLGGEASVCPDAADADDDGRLLITDAIFTLGFLFLGTAPPPSPGPVAPGEDPSPDMLPHCSPPACS